MAYQITRINDLEQFGELNTTYLLVDDAGIMPDVRTDKVFKLNDNIERIIENDKILTCFFYENEWLNKIE